MGESEQRWFCHSAGMNVCKSVAEAVHCNRDNGIVSLRHSIGTIVITTKSRPTPTTHLYNPPHRLHDRICFTRESAASPVILAAPLAFAALCSRIFMHKLLELHAS